MKTTSIAAFTLALGLLHAAPAHAQFQPRTPPDPDRVFVGMSGTGQLETRSFANGATFTSFGEAGRFDSIQSIGRGGGFDVTGAYGLTKHLRLGAGVWMSTMKSAAAATAAMPDPVVFGSYKIVSLSGTDLKQTNLGADLQLIWAIPLADRAEMSLFIGPSLIRVTQDVASIGVAPNSQTAILSTSSQSATTAKAGNAGVDVTYRVADRVGVAVFARYAGGEANLPAAPKLKVGGTQVGGGLRFRF